VVGNSLRVPQFLAAQSPLILRRLMLLNNLKAGKQYEYFSIQFSSGKWYAWFYEKEDETSLLKESK